MYVALLSNDMLFITKFQSLSKTYAKKAHVNLILEVYSNYNEELLKNKNYNAIFIDREISKELINTIASLNMQYLICLILNDDKYDLDILHYHIFDYISKPIDLYKVATLYNELHKQEYVKSKDKILRFQTFDGILELNINDILYFEYHESYPGLPNRCITIKLTNQFYIIKNNIKELNTYIHNSAFEIPHQSFIVNFSKVKQIKKYDIYLSNGEIIPLSQKRATYFREKFRIYNQSFKHIVIGGIYDKLENSI